MRSRSEWSPWSLPGGGACVFALAVVCTGLPWEVGGTAVVPAVVGWAWRARPVTGVAIGVVGWLCVTGLDVHSRGELTFGVADLARLAALALSGGLAAGARAVLDAVRRHGRADPVWCAFYTAEMESEPSDNTEFLATERALSSSPQRKSTDG